ncbi:MAG: vitamin K epoxide reductase family protein [Leptolyngbyaceae cyanobacterium bins.59]|nr:vitamin K epoxide reductase family protein [Leptolyngbyaceae cyanobacterium bins.59]
MPSDSIATRRRQVPWLHRWSRIIMAGIATIGAFGTGYLTVVKFAGGSAACPTSACEKVLSSPYAMIFGVPLTVFGCLAYLSMGFMAIAPLLINADTQKQLRRDVENLTWLGLLIGGTAMTVFSAYLMYLLVYEIKALCLYCITSAAFSLSFLVLTFLGRTWEDVGQILFMGVIVALVTLIGTLGVYSGISNPRAADDAGGKAGPVVTTPSGASEISLAEHLTKVGAKMYGAYWCPHCHDQKQLFGVQAFSKVTYVECAPDGKNAQPDLCKAQGDKIQGFPTWEVNGQFFGGTRSLQELSDLSGYKGSRDFKNAF